MRARFLLGARQGCEWDESTCTCAIDEGHLETLQWARAHGCPWDPDSCRFAAGQGHMEVLEWCKANGGRLDARTCINAAGEGHLEASGWMRREGELEVGPLVKINRFHFTVVREETSS